MASSLAPASITLGTESQVITSQQIDPILNSTYAIKGREVSINLDFHRMEIGSTDFDSLFHPLIQTPRAYFNYLGIGSSLL